jgi:hypothetical protein
MGRVIGASWSCDGEPTGRISVRSELDAVVLTYRACTSWAAEWKRIKQRVPITWTDGGRRPWFVCAMYSGGRYCGRRVAVLYGAGELFACRSCYGLAYESQQEDLTGRAQLKAQKFGLGGSWCPADLFPDKPKGMHWRTYERLCEAHDLAEARLLQASSLAVRLFRDRRPFGGIYRSARVRTWKDPDARRANASQRKQGLDALAQLTISESRSISSALTMARCSA